MLVRDRMSHSVVTISPTTSLADALALMGVHRIRHLPVVEDDALVGLVSARDIGSAAPTPGLFGRKDRTKYYETTEVEKLMTLDVVTTTPDAPIDAAARVLYERRIGCLPVVEAGRLVGVLSESDLLRALVELIGGGPVGTRIELRIPNRPGELARVLRVVGVDHRINVRGIVVPPAPGAECVAILHLDTTDARACVADLARMGYAVSAVVETPLPPPS